MTVFPKFFGTSLREITKELLDAVPNDARTLGVVLLADQITLKVRSFSNFCSFKQEGEIMSKHLGCCQNRS